MIFTRETSTPFLVFFKMWEAFTTLYSLLGFYSTLNFRVPSTFLQLLANFTKWSHINMKITIIVNIKVTKEDTLKQLYYKRMMPTKIMSSNQIPGSLMRIPLKIKLSKNYHWTAAVTMETQVLVVPPSDKLKII